MESILLFTPVFSSHSVLLIWIGGGLLFLLLCYGIYYQWRDGKKLHQELIEIDKVKQNNIEYDFVMKAMKIAVWRYDLRTENFVIENDYREGLDNYVPGANEKVMETTSKIASADLDRVRKAFTDFCEGRSEIYHQEYQVKSQGSGEMYWEV